ncbi:hypothetical protein [Alteribacillus iranensis]|uniref:Uncharacterized protein n=1 Tax=Alteribacillus iranensis TaxID=930128 RepID=A0A1I2D5T7_9BACI|nr:hypothetical protein [Alteribacillus iranensis]SFE75340.1 hypothetical protein SAMN05192532_103400 [Alteribacillus iranensis]
MKRNTCWWLIVFCTVVLVGCGQVEEDFNDYLLLTGESDSWELSGYEVEITSETFKAGNGTLHMKNETDEASDFFHFETHVVMNGEDTVVHSGSVSGPGVDISEETTGAIESGAYLDENGEALTREDIADIYMIVEWWDPAAEENVHENIELY